MHRLKRAPIVVVRRCRADELDPLMETPLPLVSLDTALLNELSCSPGTIGVAQNAVPISHVIFAQKLMSLRRSVSSSVPKPDPGSFWLAPIELA